MKLLDCLRVLAELQNGRKVEFGKIKKKTGLKRIKIKKALRFLERAAVISFNSSTVKINVKKLNTAKKRKKIKRGQKR
ncbi:MAG: hypothetical protein AB1467_01820 [Candidatus Diapherotrites archaeon]